MKVVLIVVALSVLCLAPAQAATDPRLNELAVAFAAAYNAHDAAKVAAFYTEDALLMVPNEPAIKGRASIQAFYEEQFSRGNPQLRIKPLESAISGDLAFEMGSATAILGPLSDDGKYVIVYRRVAGEWKIAFDIFNSDQSGPTMAAPTPA
jgi:ketosteroid isomerase-like protein